MNEKTESGAHDRIKELEAENKQLKKEVVGWLNWCYYLPDDWQPVIMIEKSKQALKG